MLMQKLVVIVSIWRGPASVESAFLQESAKLGLESERSHERLAMDEEQTLANTYTKSRFMPKGWGNGPGGGGDQSDPILSWPDDPHKVGPVTPTQDRIRQTVHPGVLPSPSGKAAYETPTMQPRAAYETPTMQPRAAYETPTMQPRAVKPLWPDAPDIKPQAVNLRKKAAKCFDASQFLVDFPKSKNSVFKKFSQGNQDGVMRSLFSPEYLGTTNKGFVEFGFPDSTFSTSYGNGRQLISDMGFHPELLLDGSFENPDIKLHKHFVTAENIVGLFEKYNVSKESDYVSVDIDSCDIWLFMAITKKFRPRVVTVEYNSNYGIDSYQTMGGIDNNGKQTCSKFDYTWKGASLFGGSLSAIYLAAQRREYTMVYASPSLDTFMVRNDLICPGTAPPLGAFKYATDLPLHRPYADEQGPRNTLEMDFKTWLAQNPNA